MHNCNQMHLNGLYTICTEPKNNILYILLLHFIKYYISIPFSPSSYHLAYYSNWTSLVVYDVPRNHTFLSPALIEPRNSNYFQEQKIFQPYTGVGYASVNRKLQWWDRNESINFWWENLHNYINCTNDASP